jgi:putative ABC transport system ATP-binding protein
MIQIKNLNKIFNIDKPNQYHALKNINLHIKKNELIILNGVSGSGKSTLLSIIGGLLKPSNGSIKINQNSIIKFPDTHLSDFRLKHIGFIFQSFNLLENFTVYENILSSIIPLDLPMDICTNKINEILQLTNIYHKKDEFISNLSNGEKQRVSISRALINNPNIILCDEPTASLDYDNSIIFCKILKKLKSLNKTIIVATHDTIFKELDFIDKTIIINNGEIKTEEK